MLRKRAEDEAIAVTQQQQQQQQLPNNKIKQWEYQHSTAGCPKVPNNSQRCPVRKAIRHRGVPNHDDRCLIAQSERTGMQ